MNDELLGKLIAEVKTLNATVTVLNSKIEGFRTHMGSAGYFVQTATEDLTKSVASLLSRVEALK